MFYGRNRTIRGLIAMAVTACCSLAVAVATADEPKQGSTRRVDLGDGISLEVVYIPPGKF